MAERPPEGSGSGGGGDGNNYNGKWKGKEKVVLEYGKNRHGMPVGFYFVPKDLELFAILRCKLVRGELPGALNDVFKQIRILEFHPALLHETYIGNKEDGYIYFFSRRQFAMKAGNKRRPTRVADGGTWKASGGSKTVRSKKVGGIDVGQKLTMVFYERRFDGDRNPVKTNWGMHEFTKIIPGSKNQLEDLAVYRLYKIKRKEDTEPVNAAAAASSTDEHSTSSALSPPMPPRPLPDMAGSSLAMPLLPLQLPGLAGLSSAMSLSQQLPGMAGSLSAMPLPLSLPGLAGGMMSIADHANMDSTSQASTPSSELLQDWYDEYEITYGAVALPSSPTGWWPSPNGRPVQHNGYLRMAADPMSYMLEHLLPTAAIPLEPMAPPMTSPMPPPAVDHHQLSPPQDAAGIYNHPELADYGGGVQAQHEHQQHHPQEPQALSMAVDGEDGYGAMADGGDAQLGIAKFDPGRIAKMVSQIMDGEFAFRFDDNTVIRFNDVFTSADNVAAAPMLIEAGGNGDGADGGDGDNPFDN